MDEHIDRIRVWNEETGEMIEPATVQEMLRSERNNGNAEGVLGITQYTVDSNEYGHLVFMNNTGIYDITGKEIFADDIITKSTYPYAYRVAYLPDVGQWWAISLSRSEAATQPLTNIQRPTIVGNVFENRELLIKGEIR